MRSRRRSITAPSPACPTEVRQKLEQACARPTLAQAARIEGMTPAALMLLLATVKKSPQRRSA